MREPSGVQSLDRAFGLLEALSQNPDGMHLIQLSAATGLHKSTVHRLLASLIGLGYVKKSQDVEGKYCLTMKLCQLSGRILDNIDVLQIARKSLEQLRDSTQEATHLMVQDGSDIVYVYKAESISSSFRMFSRIGMRRPMYCTAAGKSILAALTDREVAHIWENSDVKAHTCHTIVELEALFRELDGIRELGYALDNEENELGVRCIAVALKDYTGQSKAAFSISAPVVRMPDDRITQLAPVVLAVGAAISEQLGYH